jgi:hypothetical protein
MSVLRGTSLAVLITVLLSGNAAAACDQSWFSFSQCQPDYPPMIVPSFDPERGPIWTNNGWSYPQAPVVVQATPPYPPAPYGPKPVDGAESSRRPLK